MSKHFSDNGDILTLWGHVQVRWALAQYEARKRRDLALLWATRLVPKRLRYWVVVDSVAKATTGQWGTTHPDTLTWNEILDRGVAGGSLVDPQTPMRWPWVKERS